MKTHEATHPMPASDLGARSRQRGTVFLLAGLGFLTVAGCLTAPLLNMDDNFQITENPFLRPETGWWKAFTSYHYWQYIPITHLSYQVNATFFGLETAWAYRLVNWLLHATSAVVLLSTLRALGVERRNALFVACLWVVHPMACESVGWVTERSNVLAFFFGNLAFHIHVTRGDSWRAHALSAGLYGLALLSKPLALGWMPIFLAFEILGGAHRMTGTQREAPSPSPAHIALRMLPFLILTVALMFLGLSGYHGTGDHGNLRPPPGGSLFTALLTDLDLFARYVMNIIAPFRLSAFYGVNAIASLGDPRCWGWLTFWVFLLSGTVWLSTSRRRTIFGWLWFFGGLGPASNIVAIGYPMQDRFAYLSSVGLLLVMADTATGIATRLPVLQETLDRRRRLWNAILGACVVLFGALAFQRSLLWADPMALTVDAVETQPDAAIAHVFLGRQLDYQAWRARLENPPDTLHSRTLSRRAAEEYMRALSLPDIYLYNPVSERIALGGSLLESGETEKAVEVLSDVLPIPDPVKLGAENPQEGHYLVVDGPFAFPYRLAFPDASRGHQWLADAALHDLLNTTLPPSRARACLDRANRHCEWAQRHDPQAPLPYFTQAYLFLLNEVFASTPPENAQTAAQTVLKIAQPHIDALSSVHEALAELRPPVPEKRPRAMACLGMAKASFEATCRPDATPDQIQAYRKKAFLWAQRAIDFDPAFAETYWFLAEAHQRMANAARERNEVETATRLQQQAAGWLAKIKPASPRFKAAQEILSGLSRP